MFDQLSIYGHVINQVSPRAQLHHKMQIICISIHGIQRENTKMPRKVLYALVFSTGILFGLFGRNLAGPLFSSSLALADSDQTEFPSSYFGPK